MTNLKGHNISEKLTYSTSLQKQNLARICALKTVENYTKR
jgi:hypothetical protein